MMGFGGTYIANINQIASGLTGYSLKGSTTLGAGATSITVSGLDLDTDKDYEIVIELFHTAAGAADPTMTINSDTTATNYYFLSSSHQGGLTTCTGSLTNSSRLGTPVPAQNRVLSGILRLRRDAQGTAQFIGRLFTVTSTSVNFMFHSYWVTAGVNVTSLTFTNAQANGWGSGSYIRVYKVGGS